jgi:energy-coupling factor transporter ATP-binding protein EcfA2
MKITDLELEQYGIYQNESWKPAAGCLNVIMGENESGKTTLLRFIRDMMFGYERGKWQGKKGNMGFLRADGSAYRIYRDGKNKWAVNDKGEEFNDELSSLWWHGLNRGIYEKIFAVGLEDLQGTSFLADDSVRSRFFMLQGGDLVSGAMKQADIVVIGSPLYWHNICGSVRNVLDRFYGKVEDGELSGRKLYFVFQGAAPEKWMLDAGEYTMKRFAGLYGMTYGGMATNENEATKLGKNI